MVVSASTVTADGIAAATVTVTVRDASNDPISGRTVTVTYSGTGTVTPSSTTTNGSGIALFQVKSTSGTTGTLTAVVNPGVNQVTLTASPSLTFILPGCEARTPVAFNPVVQCEWAPDAGDSYPNHYNVLSAPIVIDLDLDGDPATVHPSIAFISYNYNDGGTFACTGSDPNYYGVLRVIDGATCVTQFTSGSPKLLGATSLAAGDVDLAPDGRPEIVAVAVGGHPVVFHYDSNANDLAVLWEATPVSSTCLWTGPTLADLEGDGQPEVLLGGDVYSGATGAQLAAAPFTAVNLGRYGVVADLTGGRRLVAAGATYSWNGSSWSLDTPGFGEGLMAVADMGTFGANPALDDRTVRDGIAEVVSVASGSVVVRTQAGRAVLGPLSLPNVANGGPPAIADLDGDGRAEIALSGASALVMVDPDCQGSVTAECPSGASTAVTWSVTIQDASSARSGTAAFDFENDGAAEVVHADECYVRMLDGATGSILAQTGRRSLTWYEMPVIADTDGDGRAEVIVNSNGNGGISCPVSPPSPARTGVQVLGEDVWARARPVWNQHVFLNGAITDAGAVPANPVQDFSLTGPNGFRLQDACTQ
jgi:hypothetical protein